MHIIAMINVTILKVLTDVESRYITETNSPDIPPLGVIITHLNEAIAYLRTVGGRYLSIGSNDIRSIDSPVVIDLDMTTRRISGKQKALEHGMRSFLVEHTLSGIFSQYGMQDRANTHKEKANDVATMLSELINTKIPIVR